MTSEQLDKLRNELSVKAKNGIDFMAAATIVWFSISYIWTLDFSAYNKSIFVFIIGGIFMPLAFLFSKIFRTNWKIANNPLQSLGLWLNFAQLFYFPFLIFIMIKAPEYFIMTYAIITGAHFFPYSWFYKTIWYALFAGLITLGTLLIALLGSPENMYLVGILTGTSTLTLAILLNTDVSRKKTAQLSLDND